MQLRLADTLVGRSAPVRVTSGRSIALYVCGPTVYDRAHAGHARTYLLFDVARRFLEAEGNRVRHVMNITDVEEKIDRRAASLGLSPSALARREERAFVWDLADLGVLLPTVRPRASEHVPEMIEAARALERTGRVHRTAEGWMYDAPPRAKGENFLTSSELADHAVEEPEHPFDAGPEGGRSFLLWKPQAPPLPSWPSPWGPGVPGWHLECFAMARRFLRIPVDLHGGGRDLVYPHHFAENEIALALHRVRFSRNFFHPAFVLQNGAKMSKSLGNLVPLRSTLAEVGAGALRWYLLAEAPQDRLEWDPRALARAAEEYRRVRRAVRAWLRGGAGGKVGAKAAEGLASEVRACLARGLRTDRAIGRLRALRTTLERDPSGRVARGEGARARLAVRSVARRIGLPLA